MENRKPQLLPGFRFQPTDEELVVHYLKPKIQSLPLPNYPITEADVCGSDPWNLLGDSEEERYFFSTVETKYPNGKRINRTAPSGHWKPTSLDKQVVDSQNKHVGTKKTFVFHRSKSANGSKIDWLMHEYKLANPIQGVQNWMICRLFTKKRAKKDTMEDVEMVLVRNTGTIFYVPRNFDLNLDGGGSPSTGSSGVTDEDGENNK
ncbi:putative transcription factor NAM family [Helianthus debilis subsp. tardiflorus]